MKADITLEEILVALGQPQGHQEGFHSVVEWSALWRCGNDKTRSVLRLAMDQGKLLTEKRRLVSLDGKPRETVVYGFSQIT